MQSRENLSSSSWFTSTQQIPARIVFYFAGSKFLVGALSGAAAAWTVEQPLLAVFSGGYNDSLGITTLYDDPILYVALLVGCWSVGVICTFLVPKVSVPLTAWACCDVDGEDEVMESGSDSGNVEGEGTIA
ncbi:unnamed protein product [Phytophthora lilii]|uniref:Unnamed protein product n=1 Tax=Phytophthora lilii TaxID=2077276 RepID=A0A9W6WHH6_9STRA|nr:unnamed protein product [Phytophthora lilii]